MYKEGHDLLAVFPVCMWVMGVGNGGQAEHRHIYLLFLS